MQLIRCLSPHLASARPWVWNRGPRHPFGDLCNVSVILARWMCVKACMQSICAAGRLSSCANLHGAMLHPRQRRVLQISAMRHSETALLHLHRHGPGRSTPCVEFSWAWTLAEKRPEPINPQRRTLQTNSKRAHSAGNAFGHTKRTDPTLRDMTKRPIK